MANRGNITAGSDTSLYSSAGSGCTSFRIDVPSGSSYGVLVNVAGLHQATEYYPIPAGGSATFRLGNNGITSVVAQGDGGTATNVTWSPVSKTAA